MHYKALINKDKLQVTGDGNELPEFRPFPSLVDALKTINEDTGFNIEIKYPMKLKVECKFS